MVHQKISNDMKGEAPLLAFGSRMGDREDCRNLGHVGENHWAMGRECLHDCVKPLKSIEGRPRLITGDMIDDTQLLLREDPTLLLDEIKEWLALYHDQPASATALHMRCHRYCFVGPKPLLLRPQPRDLQYFHLISMTCSSID